MPFALMSTGACAFALGRFSGRVAQVRIVLGDQGASTGGLNKICHIRVGLCGLPGDVIQLAFLAVAADLAVLLVELAAGVDPFTDFQQRPFLYAYLFMGTIVAFGAFGALLGSREALLKEMALRDSLSLRNSRYLDARLQEELVSAERHEGPTSFVLFDIDHFKKVNRWRSDQGVTGWSLEHRMVDSNGRFQPNQMMVCRRCDWPGGTRTRRVELSIVLVGELHALGLETKRDLHECGSR